MMTKVFYSHGSVVRDTWLLPPLRGGGGQARKKMTDYSDLNIQTLTP